MSTIILLATRYDRSSLYTYSWATELQQDLIQQGHTCILMDASLVCQGRLLHHALQGPDVVVFYGHGEPDQWIALPAGAASASRSLVDTKTIQLLAGRPTYAGCCHSLGGLGSTYANTFAGGFANAAYIGYADEFGFEFTNERHFKDVANLSVAAFVNGDAASKVVADLKQAWADLRDEFHHGRLKSVPNAAMASYLADLNEQRIGTKP
jgi:hypothetical protein